MKKKLLYVFLVIVVLAVLALIVTLLVLGRPSLGLDASFEGKAEKKISRSTDKAPEEMVRCYDYIEKYFLGTITNDEEMLEQIVADINTIIEKDYYCSNFYGSQFAERLENDPDFLKNGGFVSRNFLVAEYYREIIIVELKALLMLGHYEEFEDIFIANYYLISSGIGEMFNYVIDEDMEISQNQDHINIIMDAYDTLIEYNLTDEAKWFIATDATKMISVGDSVEGRTEPFRSIIQELRHREYYDTVYMLENEELNPNGFSVKLGVVFVK